MFKEKKIKNIQTLRAGRWDFATERGVQKGNSPLWKHF